MTKLYVGNLPYSYNDESLKNLFANYSSVTTASIIIDRATGRSKGFGFVELEDDSQAEAAIAELGGKEVEGRSLVVNVAKPMEDRPRRTFDRNGGGNGGGFGGNNRRGGFGGGRGRF